MNANNMNKSLVVPKIIFVTWYWVILQHVSISLYLINKIDKHKYSTIFFYECIRYMYPTKEIC